MQLSFRNLDKPKIALKRKNSDFKLLLTQILHKFTLDPSAQIIKARKSKQNYILYLCKIESKLYSEKITNL